MNSKSIVMALCTALTLAGCQMQVALGPNTRDNATGVGRVGSSVDQPERSGSVGSHDLANDGRVVRQVAARPADLTGRTAEWSASDAPSGHAETRGARNDDPASIQLTQSDAGNASRAILRRDGGQKPGNLWVSATYEDSKEPNGSPLPPADPPEEEGYPINLATALQLAGADNLQIAMATERVNEALARLEGAEVLWIPSINAGVGYNSHAGQIQATEGRVVRQCHGLATVLAPAWVPGWIHEEVSGGCVQFGSRF